MPWPPLSALLATSPCAPDVWQDADGEGEGDAHSSPVVGWAWFGTTPSPLPHGGGGVWHEPPESPPWLASWRLAVEGCVGWQPQEPASPPPWLPSWPDALDGWVDPHPQVPPESPPWSPLWAPAKDRFAPPQGCPEPPLSWANAAGVSTAAHSRAATASQPAARPITPLFNSLSPDPAARRRSMMTAGIPRAASTATPQSVEPMVLATPLLSAGCVRPPPGFGARAHQGKEHPGAVTGSRRGGRGTHPARLRFRR